MSNDLAGIFSILVVFGIGFGAGVTIEGALVTNRDDDKWRGAAAWQECGLTVEGNGSVSSRLLLKAGDYTIEGTHIMRNGRQYCRGGVVP